MLYYIYIKCEVIYSCFNRFLRRLTTTILFLSEIRLSSLANTSN